MDFDLFDSRSKGRHYINRQFCRGIRVFVWIPTILAALGNFSDKHPGTAWMILAGGIAWHAFLSIAVAVMEIAEATTAPKPMELAPPLKVRPAAKATDEEKW